MRLKKPYIIIFLLFFLNFITEGQNTDWQQNMKNHLEKLADFLSTHLKPWKIPYRIYRVEDFGAKHDGSTMNTKSIQAAIDTYYNAG